MRHETDERLMISCIVRVILLGWIAMILPHISNFLFLRLLYMSFAAVTDHIDKFPLCRKRTCVTTSLYAAAVSISTLCEVRSVSVY